MNKIRTALVMTLAIGLVLLAPPRMAAHCDTIGGPVVTDAKIALEKQDVTPVLKWVKAQDEQEIRALFSKTLKVRAQGPEAHELADHYFFETLVRVHRAGEGAPYTGLKLAEGAVAGIAAADAAIATGSAEKLIDKATSEMAAGIRRRWQRVTLARRHADDNVEAGREYVAAYIDFIHYVEGLHRTVANDAPVHDAVAAAPVHQH